MSGIFGIIRLDGRPVEQRELVSMADRMPYRGPDGRTFFVDGNVGLGHLWLRTSDRSAHNVEIGRNGVHITADARIDNRAELLRDLELRQTDVPTDAHLLLACYERWGRDSVDRLVGDFAFAIWDQNEGRLFCVRDHFGVRPLHYAIAEGQLLAFSSEAKALFALPEFTRRLNEVRMADYLTTTFEDGAITEFEGVLRVPAAHTMSMTGAAVDVRRYWRLSIGEEIRHASPADYVEEFRERFREAVHCRIAGVDDVGSELSGGLDSSYVTAIAADIRNKEGMARVKTSSIIFPETPESDESHYINHALGMLDVEPHFIAADGVGPLTLLDDIFAVRDDGRVNGTHHLYWQNFKNAANAGARVLLTGFDGDTTISHGVQILGEYAKAGRWVEFSHEVKALERRHSEIDHGHDQDHMLQNPGWAIESIALPQLREFAIQGRTGHFVKGIRTLSTEFGIPIRRSVQENWRRLLVPERLIRRRYGTPAPWTSSTLEFIDPAFADRIGARARINKFTVPSGHELVSTVKGSQLMTFKSDRFTISLESQNLYGAAHGIEVTHPFTDKRLLEWCLNLPSQQRLGDGWTRSILRNAMKDVLPAEIYQRQGKANMRKSFRQGLLVTDAQRLEKHVYEPGILGDYINRKRFIDLYESRHNMTGSSAWALAFFAGLSLWLDQQYGDG